MGLKQFTPPSPKPSTEPDDKPFVRRIRPKLILDNFHHLPPELQDELADERPADWPYFVMKWYMLRAHEIPVMKANPTLSQVKDNFKHLPIELQQELHCDQLSQWSRRVTEWSKAHWRWVDETFYGSHRDDEEEDRYLTREDVTRDIFNENTGVLVADSERIWRAWWRQRGEDGLDSQR